MSSRKKWRLKVYPSFNYLTVRSMKQAYEDVQWFRECYATGASPVHQINVEVEDGHGWQTYEIVTFPERDA